MSFTLRDCPQQPRFKARPSPIPKSDLFTKCLTLTAMPLRSDEADAAVAEVFATVLVLVSEMWILCNGMPKLRAATCEKNKKNKRKENISVARIERKHLFVYGYIPLHWS